MKKLLIFSLLSLLFSCSKSIPDYVDPLQKIEIKVTEKIEFKYRPPNPYGHTYQYTYSADRGQLITNKFNGKTFYYAPFTGGPDTIRVSVFDKTDNINLPVIYQQLFVQGETISYVELPKSGTQLNDTENGSIKVSSVRGSIPAKEIGWGRNPTISTDGKFIAFVNYPGDGSSQIIIKDPAGTETNITNNKFINKDPSWSPVEFTGPKYLVFSSDMNSEESTPKKFHIWKENILTREMTRLTMGKGNDIQPDWSPDGQSIVFISNLDNFKETNYSNFYILKTATNARIQLTHEKSENNSFRNPKWSPDALKVAYTKKYQEKQADKIVSLQKIWVVNANLKSDAVSKKFTKDSDETIIEDFPSWSPDGRSISYARTIGKANSLYSFEIISQKNNVYNTKDPVPEGEFNNITETSWARQRSYGYGTKPGINNPFNLVY
jgi:dipeptidyl aminopeptidase/acylaminoacyl peptidase